MLTEEEYDNFSEVFDDTDFEDDELDDFREEPPKEDVEADDEELLLF